MVEIIKRTTIKALIEKDGKVLILKDEKGVWELPGGKIDGSDSEEDTLRRELNEELGIANAEIGPQIHIFDFETQFKDTTFKFHVIVRKCDIDDTNLKISPEHTKLAWIDPKDVNNYKMRDGYKETIKLYEKN